MSAVEESPVLQAVANPPLMMYIPMTAFGLNTAGGLALWMILFVLFDIGLWVMILIIGAIHLFLISLTTRDPHLETMAKSIGFYWRSTPNIIPSRHRRYVP